MIVTGKFHFFSLSLTVIGLYINHYILIVRKRYGSLTYKHFILLYMYSYTSTVHVLYTTSMANNSFQYNEHINESNSLVENEINIIDSPDIIPMKPFRN